MKPKTIAVFGAMGRQGGSVIDSILNDNELSKEWQIRAVVRWPFHPRARALKKKGVEVVRADMSHESALKDALDGVHTVFLVTVTIHQEQGSLKEINQGKAVAGAAVAAGAKYIIFSGGMNMTKLTGGKLPKVEHFDSKARIEDYIRGLPICSAFIYPGIFMSNFFSQYKPKFTNDDAETHAVVHVCNEDTKLPLLATEHDFGKWVTPILANQDNCAGAVFHAAVAEYTFGEAVEIMSKTTGRSIRYVKLPDAEYEEYLLSKGSDFSEALLQMGKAIRDYNLFGPQQKQLIEQSTQHARGKLTTLEEYFAQHPLGLE